VAVDADAGTRYAQAVSSLAVALAGSA